MTFFEAALHILEKEGKPLSFKYIAEKAVADKLLSHVGKDPEATMYWRLAAMAKRKGDRKIVATEPGTFGLLDWGVQEDSHALEVNPLPQPDETEPPLRPRERHPMPRGENVRTAGRGERRKHHEDREKKRRSVLPELAFEVLSQQQGPMPAVDLAAALRETEKVSEDLGAEAVLQALRDDNRRREHHNRRPLFILSESGEVGIDRAGSPREGVPVELEAALAQSLGMQLESPQPARPGPGLQRILQQAREHQKNIGRVLRRRIGDLEIGALEIAAVALLEGHGFRDVRATKRGREGLVLTGRRREGLLDVRYAARVIKGAREVQKTDVSDLRRELVNYNAHVGLLLCAGEVARDARTEALGGGALMLLWCGEALAEKLAEKKVGAHAVTVELPDVDEGFWRRARDQGEIEDRRREERRRERDEREAREKAEREAAQPLTQNASESEAAAAAAESPAGEATPALEVHVDLQQPATDAATAEALAQALVGHEPAPVGAAEPKPEEKS